MQVGKVLPQLPTRVEQRLNNLDRFGDAFDELADPRLKLHASDDTDLETEVSEHTAQVVLDGDRLFCSSLRAVSRARRFWLVSVLKCTGRYRFTRIIWAMPRASLRSLLFGCALRNALVCLVSMQITGKPALARPSNSHCDNGPASSPIRPIRKAGSFKNAIRSSGG